MDQSGKFLDISCENNQDNLCAICQIDEIPKFSLRGLCSDSKFDSKYRWTGDVIEGRFAFNGHDNSIIHFNKTLQQWFVKYEKDPSIYAYSNISPYLFTTAAWFLVNDHCDGVKYDYREVKLMYNACGDNQFNCDNAVW